MVLDGMRSIDAAIMACFVKAADGSHFEDKNRFQMSIVYEEEALRSRKQLARGMIAQTEGLHLFSKGAFDIPNKIARLHYPGTNQGATIGPVRVEKYEESSVWKLAKESKTKLYGSGGKILVGGAGGQNTPRPKLANDLEPVAFHGSPLPFYREILHSYCPACVFNACDVDGKFALAAIMHKTPYVGVVFNGEHKKMMTEHLVTEVWSEYLKQESPLYEVGLQGPQLFAYYLVDI